MSSLIQTPAWQALIAHKKTINKRHMRDLFAQDTQRFERFSLIFEDLLLDYSKNLITDETMDLLHQLAQQEQVEQSITGMFGGDNINHTEQLPALHIALRNRSQRPILVDGQDVMPLVNTELQKMRTFSEALRTQAWQGFSGQPITDVVNLGVGGSDQGPAMATEALRPYAKQDLNIHFVSNVDENNIADTLTQLKPETTLVILVSKSFTTQDTMVNAETAKQWLMKSSGDALVLKQHMLAVTSNPLAAEAFGLHKENIFGMWEWVGGRYSMWSAVGLSIAMAVGMDNFEAMLEGAHAMDEHFRSAPLSENLPVIMALLGIWYNNFFAAQSLAILPYEQHLQYLPAYLQQTDMESNGKRIDRDGQVIDYSTGPVIFGTLGITGQHAFYQSLHQGTRLVPADFLVPIESFHCNPRHQYLLMANAFAQTEALMKGKTEQQAHDELEAAGLSADTLERLLPHKIFEGNKPTNTIIYKRLTPQTLGMLIALYEHKIFVQGIIWRVNPFDQWGVELGKQLSKKILRELDNNEPVTSHDASTNGLINYYKDKRRG